MNTVLIDDRRVEKLKLLCQHPWYGKLCRRLSEKEFDFCVEFCEDFAELDPGEFEKKVNRLFLDQQEKPKNMAIMCDILLACKKLT